MNILTIDLEEWFHILDNGSTRTEKEWSIYESRIDENAGRIIDMLQERKQEATFFCLGWITRTYPRLVRKISDLGFHVACHSDAHQLVYEQDPEAFRKDLDTAIKTLEDCTGKKVTTYRAPGFSITNQTTWAFEILAEYGITCDSSVFPASRGHGGFPEIPFNTPFLIRVNGKEILEYPLNIVSFLGKKIVFSGGGYFRLFPYGMIKYWSKRSPYIMTYFHPRDFDPGQPVISDLPAIRRFKSYTGLKSSAGKFNRWISEFRFVNLETAIQQTERNNLPVYNLQK